MSESFVCGDPGALVSYVYDECEPEERNIIAAHLARCVSCARDVDEMGATRRDLVSWSPPAADLGFRIPDPEGPVKASWWRAPLPAWAQAAAAVLIFGAGLSTGWARSPGVGPQPRAQTAAAAAATADAASRTELAAMEQRLEAEMARLRTAATPAAAPEGRPGDDAIMRRVQTLVEESEERQRREFTLRAVELARDFEAQRRVDLASMRETFGQFQGVAGAEIRQQREAIDRIMISLQER
jgi:hypothetical protein